MSRESRKYKVIDETEAVILNKSNDYTMNHKKEKKTTAITLKFFLVRWKKFRSEESKEMSKRLSKSIKNFLFQSQSA